jgi:hypothetical protein
METNQATENLQTIRTLMERSALYRRALTPIMIFCGSVGIAGSVAGWLLKMNSAREFVLFWYAMALLALIGSFLLVRRQALKDSEPFWSPPTRRVGQALLPPLLVGACLGIAPLITSADGGEMMSGLIIAWMLLYGCALLAASFFMPRGVKVFGWLYIFCACGLFYTFASGLVDVMFFDIHWIMGFFFGGLHLACGIYLYFTEKRRDES